MTKIITFSPLLNLASYDYEKSRKSTKSKLITEIDNFDET